MKQWLIKPKYSSEFAKKFPEIDLVILQLLYNRGLADQTTIDEFLNPDYSQDLHDPFLFQDMQKACQRISKAVENQEKIVIHGDYDVDGVTGSAVIYHALKRLGAQNVEVYIPHRVLEGYGLSTDTVRELSNKKINLIVTVDCGITNIAEVGLANQLGLDVIVTDHHHQPETLPPAYAIICCSSLKDSYPFKKLAGVGVAFKLAQALFRLESFPKKKSNSLVTSGKLQVTNNHEAYEKWLLDLVALGTVADYVPLLGENRTLVKWGMYVLNKTKRKGLQELCKVSATEIEKIDTLDIGFRLGPRINAAGRMDHANLAFQLLITDDEVEALAAAGELDQKNKERQKLTEEMVVSAREQAEQQKDNKVLIIAGDNWSTGLVGLVAGKLSDEFYRPTFVFGKTEDKYTASGRSIEEFSIIEAITDCAEFLDHFGGHDQACGLTIFGEENFQKFKIKINHLADKKLKNIKLVPNVHIEAEIKLDDANWQLLDELEKFKPFGESNPHPIFVSKNITIYQVEAIGKDQNTLKLVAHSPSNSDHPRKFIGFRIAQDWINKLQTGDKVDIVYEIGVNEWNGNREIQLKIVDLKIK